LQEEEYLSFELSLENDRDEYEANKEKVNWVVGTNYCGNKVDEDKEVRVGIKDWLVHFSSYKKLLIVCYLGKTSHEVC
jgi:hypothetical protein